MGIIPTCIPPPPVLFSPRPIPPVLWEGTPISAIPYRVPVAKLGRMGEIGGEPSWEYAENFASEEGEVVGDDGDGE